MASTSAEVFAAIRSGQRPTEQQVSALLQAPAAELFGDLVEPMADSFDPAMVESYVDVFGRLLERLLPELGPLRERYLTVRTSRPSLEPKRVVVLSRVTLGADVAITSTLLAAARNRWPRAELMFCGPQKNHELFSGVGLLEGPYRRTGTLEERVRAGLALAPLLADADTLVIDPDSRLSQLGLLPLAAVERTLFFESRAVGGETDSLVALTRRFAAEMLGVEAAPWVSAGDSPGAFDVAVSFGVGENPAKRAGDTFEAALLRALVDRGWRVLLDSGAPGTAEWDRAAALEPCGVTLWRGSFATFAAAIRECGLYIGYDSAGQHVAAACGVPRVTVFAGHPSERFAARWRPDGPGASEVVANGPELLDRVLEGVDRIG